MLFGKLGRIYGLDLPSVKGCIDHSRFTKGTGYCGCTQGAGT